MRAKLTNTTMTTHLSRLLVVFLLGFLFAGCFGCEEKEPETFDEHMEEAVNDLEEAAKDLEEAGDDLASSGAEGMAALGEALQNFGQALNDGAKVEPVDFRDLLDLLPKRVDGMPQTDYDGQRGGNPIVNASEVEGTYEEGERRLEIKIVDPGSMTAMARLGYSWLALEIDQESVDGFERTLKFKGFPAHQEFEHERGEKLGTCSMSVYVGDRFIVTADGDNVTMDTCEEGIEETDLSELEDMKSRGVSN
jgi:hypothetical protein